MITTKIVEVSMNDAGALDETELGWCKLAEVPIEKRAPQTPKDGEPLPAPMIVKIGGSQYFVIGQSWEIELTEHPYDVDEGATLVLIVQKVPVAPSVITLPEKSSIIIPGGVN